MAVIAKATKVRPERGCNTSNFTSLLHAISLIENDPYRLLKTLDGKKACLI